MRRCYYSFIPVNRIVRRHLFKAYKSKVMNETEFKSIKGAVGLRLEEKGGFKRLEDELASLSTRIPKLGKKTRIVVKRLGICGVFEYDDGSVAFSVSLSVNTSFRSDEVLLFDEVLINEGDGFKPYTGEFIAPVSAKYLFSVTIRAQYHKQVSAELVCNGKILGRVTSGYGCIDKATASVTIAVELRRSDVVLVKQTAARSGDYHGNGYTTFTGLTFD